MYKYMWLKNNNSLKNICFLLFYCLLIINLLVLVLHIHVYVDKVYIAYHALHLKTSKWGEIFTDKTNDATCIWTYNNKRSAMK